MSVLFTVENRIVRPNTETLLIPPFKDIWERDKTKGKTFALEDFAYMEFMTSYKKTNPYAGYDPNLRKERIKADIITKAGWKEDKLIVEGMKKIEEFQMNASVTYTYYTATRKAAEQMKVFFNNLNIGDVNFKTGNPLYKPADITRAMKDSEEVMRTLDSLKDKVEQELFENTKTKGQKEISPFADPSSIT